jgi:hypothetical protein
MRGKSNNNITIVVGDKRKTRLKIGIIRKIKVRESRREVVSIFERGVE